MRRVSILEVDLSLNSGRFSLSVVYIVNMNRLSFVMLRIRKFNKKFQFKGNMYTAPSGSKP